MIHDGQGREWVTAEEAREQGGPRFTDERLRQWKHRGRVRAKRIGRVNHYLLDDLLTADRDTRRHRRAGMLAGRLHTPLCSPCHV